MVYRVIKADILDIAFSTFRKETAQKIAQLLKAERRLPTEPELDGFMMSELNYGPPTKKWQSNESYVNKQVDIRFKQEEEKAVVRT